MKAGFNCEIKECREKRQDNELDVNFKKLPSAIVLNIYLVFWAFVFVALFHWMDEQVFVELLKGLMG